MVKIILKMLVSQEYLNIYSSSVSNEDGVKKERKNLQNKTKLNVT